ncbi:MAG: RDD family protein [Verrucomicrobiaceae bacterium]|nr:MAG: RDD family protein [Verrucomicrobiaceae bacterium]
MDAEPDKETEANSGGLPKPVIPPPNIPPPQIPSPPSVTPPPQPSAAAASTPPPVTAGGAAVKVNLRTGDDPVPEGVTSVPFNTRIIAAVIDIVVAAGVAILLALVLPSFASKLAWLVSMAYIVTRDSLPFLGGQSVGKKAMKIRAVTLEGQPLTGNWEKGGIRNAVLLIPFFGLVELYILLTRETGPDRGRRLGDEWAKTKVIFEPLPETGGEESGA